MLRFLLAFHSIFRNNLLLSWKKSIILFNSYFSYYFFQNLTNFDIDSNNGVISFQIDKIQWYIIVEGGFFDW